MQPDDGVDDVGAELARGLEVGLVDLGEAERLAAERFEDGVVFLDAGLELDGKFLGLGEVDEAQAGARGPCRRRRGPMPRLVVPILLRPLRSSRASSRRR